ncbi:hypothetical protein IWW40_003718 [Coemansia sp. RSA 1250]|nr:hypothetical protein IWW40_003718 [Coemansia sp. RSA 1250]
MAVVRAQQTGALQPTAQMPFGAQRMGTFTPIRLIQPQTPEQRQAIDNLVQELQRISPQLFSTAGQSTNQQLAIALPSSLQSAGAQPAQQTATAPQAAQFPPAQPAQPISQEPPLQNQPIPQVQPAQQTPSAQPALQTQAPQEQAPQTQAPQEQAPQTQAPQEQAPQAQIPQAPAPQEQAPQAQTPQAAPEPSPTPEQPDASPAPAADQETSSDPADSEIPLSFALNALFHTASSTAETSSDSLPFGLHFDTSSSELGRLEFENSSRESASSRTRGSSMGSSALDEWAGLDSSAARPAVSLGALGLSLIAICGL